MTIRRSVCALDCPDACALHVEIDDTGHGRKLRGDPDHPVTRGFLCGKVARYLEHQYHPDRLLHPLRRTGNKGEARFERIAWDDALDTVAARLQQISAVHGPEAILPYSYGGNMGMLNGGSMDRRFFHRLGASRLDRTICASAGAEALMRSQGARLGVEPEQFVNARLILAWGANILGTNVHLWPFIVEARRKGARFYVIDPIRNRTGHAADRHFALNPGSDLALALGLAHIILRQGWHDADYVHQYSNGFAELQTCVADYPPERVAHLTGLPMADIELLAREYAQIQPAVIRLNYGVQRSEHGGNAVRAIAALPVLTGAWRHAGGGLQLTTSGAFAFNKAALEMPELQRQSPLGREARLVNMSLLGSALTSLAQPRIAALVVYNSNPAVIAPDQNKVLSGLARPDLFTVVLEQHLTETARYADLVLPATTFLENTDLYFAYGHYYVQMARPALAPAGEARSNTDVFRSLARRMGWTDSWIDDSDHDLIRAALNTSSPYLKNITFEQLYQQRWLRLNIASKGEPFLPFANGGFATASGRFEFGAENFNYQSPAESRLSDNRELVQQYPLQLVTSKHDGAMNSTFSSRPELRADAATLLIHPDDAAARNIAEGDPVSAWNARGRVNLKARPSLDVSAGTVCVRGIAGSSLNVLTSERLTDIGHGPTFYNCLVQIALIR